MAYLHFKILNGGFDTKFECKFDGALPIYFKNGEYVKIGSGKHLITFDGGGTEWNIQETLSDDDCLNIEIMVAFNEDYGHRAVAGTPEYRIIPLNRDMIDDIEERIKELAEARSKKARKIWKIVLLAAAAFFGFMTFRIFTMFPGEISVVGLMPVCICGVATVASLVGSFLIKTK